MLQQLMTALALEQELVQNLFRHVIDAMYLKGRRRVIALLREGADRVPLLGDILKGISFFEDRLALISGTEALVAEDIVGPMIMEEGGNTANFEALKLVILDLSPADLTRFYQYVTARKTMPLKAKPIEVKWDDSGIPNSLPTAHTCFSEITLSRRAYEQDGESREATLARQLKTALDYSKGFSAD